MWQKCLAKGDGTQLPTGQREMQSRAWEGEEAWGDGGLGRSQRNETSASFPLLQSAGGLALVFPVPVCFLVSHSTSSRGPGAVCVGCGMSWSFGKAT